MEKSYVLRITAIVVMRPRTTPNSTRLPADMNPVFAVLCSYLSFMERPDPVKGSNSLTFRATSIF